MKKLILTLALACMSFTVYASAEKPKTKQVCSDVKNKSGKVVKNKDGTNKQTCRTIKIHKKYEGTTVQGTPPVKK
jgi:hypothetical protein